MRNIFVSALVFFASQNTFSSVSAADIKELRNEYNKLYSSSKLNNLQVHGFTFGGQPENLLKMMKILLGNRPMVETKRGAGEPVVFNFLKKVYKSDEAAYRTILAHFKYGYNFSFQYAGKKQQLFSEEEIRKLYFEVAQLPKRLHFPDFIKGFARDLDGWSSCPDVRYGVCAVEETGMLHFNSRAFIKDNIGKALIRGIFRMLDFQSRKKVSTFGRWEREWLRLRGWEARVEIKDWIKSKYKGKILDRIPILHTYWIIPVPGESKPLGITPDDDLAEAILYYRYEPYYLDEKYSNEYSFIKRRIFGGIEFKQWFNNSYEIKLKNDLEKMLYKLGYEDLQDPIIKYWNTGSRDMFAKNFAEKVDLNFAIPFEDMYATQNRNRHRLVHLTDKISYERKDLVERWARKNDAKFIDGSIKRLSTTVKKLHSFIGKECPALLRLCTGSNYLASCMISKIYEKAGSRKIYPPWLTDKRLRKYLVQETCSEMIRKCYRKK